MPVNSVVAFFEASKIEEIYRYSLILSALGAIVIYAWFYPAMEVLGIRGMLG